ncbi:hypothetical protein HDU86_000051 [Geranomyces michiganensis]|nr:hypothetical protein HDU86_000051 [Geranomyces michiganensis]
MKKAVHAVLVAAVAIAALAADNAAAQGPPLAPYLPWSDCSTNSSAPLKPLSVRATYDRDARLLSIVGQAITTAAALGNVPLGTPRLTNGTIQTALQIVGFEARGTTADLCTAIACPVLLPVPGGDSSSSSSTTFEFTKTIVIPINLPFVDWNPRVSILDGTQDARELMCVRVRLGLVSSNLSLVLIYASVLVALSAGFTTVATRYLRSGYMPTIYDLSSGWAPTARLLPSRIGPSFTHVVLFAQFMASTGQLDFAYPSAYQDFVRLLSWATGTWNVAFIRSFARTIRGGGLVVLSRQEADAKARTGASIIKIFGRHAAADAQARDTGTGTGTGGGASIINILSRQLTTTTPAAAAAASAGGSSSSSSSSSPQASFDGVPANTALTGYERYAAMVGMPSNEMFLNTLISYALCLLLIVLGCTVLALIRAYYRRKTNTDCDVFAHEDDQAHHIRHYMGGWAVRTTILFYFGLTSTALHQLTLSNEPAAVMALAGIVFIAVGVLVPLAMTVRLVGISRMNRSLERKDPEYADEVYARSIRGNIQTFRSSGAASKAKANGGGGGGGGAPPTRVLTRTRDAAVEREAAEVYARMRALSVSSSSNTRAPSRALSVASSLTDAAAAGAPPIPFKPLRAFSVSSAATTATAASRSSAWPLPPLYLSQKFMLLYGPFLNNYDPSHFIAHAEFLIPFTWYLRLAPAFAIGILGKITPPYLQFIALLSGDALLFFYLMWKSPYAGKSANRWQWFLAFCRCGIVVFVFVMFAFQQYWNVDWMAQLVAGGVVLSFIGVLGLFAASSGFKFLALLRKGFKRKQGARNVVATDPVHLHTATLDRGDVAVAYASSPSLLPRRAGNGGKTSIRRAASPTALSRSASARTGKTTSVRFSDDDGGNDDDDCDNQYAEQQQPDNHNGVEKRADSSLLRNAGPNPSSSTTTPSSSNTTAAAAAVPLSSLQPPTTAVTRPTHVTGTTATATNVYSEEDYFSRARAMRDSLNNTNNNNNNNTNTHHNNNNNNNDNSGKGKGNGGNGGSGGNSGKGKGNEKDNTKDNANEEEDNAHNASSPAPAPAMAMHQTIKLRDLHARRAPPTRMMMPRRGRFTLGKRMPRNSRTTHIRVA